MQPSRPMYTDADRQAEYERAIAEEARRYAEIARTADAFLQACRAMGADKEPFYGGLVWLAQAANRVGCPTRLPADFVRDPNGFGAGRSGWPVTSHLKLHWLGDRDGGWTCQICGAGLVDVCSDLDTIVASDGGRMIRPGSSKRLPTIDHKVPRNLGGSENAGNLQLVCQPCNSSKGAS